MATTSFLLNVSHSQVAVFDSGLQQPFNGWTERHVNQGFAWRPGSVSFATIEEAGRHSVSLDVVSGNVGVSPEAIRVIQTPFEVPQTGAIEIASASDSVPFSLPSGTYALRFEYFCASALSDPGIRFLFMKMENPSFEILRADSGLSAKAGDLFLSASPA
ncbi:competence protein ComJ [Methyloferula stellata]|uniref:competence protein ComJ n=1 Tax=Methyloferula stellata TaxID=876270 RepID=UPI00036A6641|nr:competence protein ComJ [Methyloferula stellata]